MKPYRWTCHVCESSNEPAAKNCAACGFPAVASAADIEVERRSRGTLVNSASDAGIFQVFALLIDCRGIKIVLVIVGLLFTLFVGRYLAFAFLSGLVSVMPPPGHGDLFFHMIALGGVGGISSAWARVLLDGETFANLAWLRYSVCFGLALGILTAIFIAARIDHSESLLTWVYLCAATVGVFLLAGTVSPQHGTAA
jgi:hypothetical protein